MKEEYLVTTGLYRTEVYESKYARENYKNQQIIQGEHVSLPDKPQYELI